MQGKRVLVYCSNIDDLMSGVRHVAGIQVQMFFWAKTFASNGWTVFSLTDKTAQTIDGITFIQKKKRWMEKCRLSIISEIIDAAIVIRKSNPDLLLFRGASRCCFFLNIFARLFGCIFVFFSASDSDFEIGRELVGGARHNVTLFRKSVRDIPIIVTQNKVQSQLLQSHYHKKSLLLPNIWVASDQICSFTVKYDAVWVANLRKLKRVEWFIRLAGQMTNRRFAVVGGIYANETAYYEKVKSMADTFPNLDFLGSKSFGEVNELMCKTKLLICTSEFEGFPNTFLQAWSVGVPVVSTVNPNGAITDNNLGVFVKSERELFSATDKLLVDDLFYHYCRRDINHYFQEHHNAETALDKLLQYKLSAR